MPIESSFTSEATNTEQDNNVEATTIAKQDNTLEATATSVDWTTVSTSPQIVPPSEIVMPEYNESTSSMPETVVTDASTVSPILQTIATIIGFTNLTSTSEAIVTGNCWFIYKFLQNTELKMGFCKRFKFDFSHIVTMNSRFGT